MGIFINNISNLKKYKYQGEDRSITTKYFLKPYWWSTFVKIFPPWFAPNLVTLSGFFFMLASLLTVFYYDPYLNNVEVPRWTYVWHAFALFMYQTFDACDGMQARKTGQSGPLGELFDHCVDALNTTLSFIVFASVTKIGFSPLFFFIHFLCLFNFYISTWEEYHTHILFLSEFSGPVEGILMLVVLYLCTAYFGADIWLTVWAQVDLSQNPFVPKSLVDLLHYFNLADSNGILSIDSTFIYEVLGFPSLIFNIYSAYANVHRCYLKHPDAEQKTAQAMQGIGPFLTYYATVVIYVFLTSPYIFEHGFLALILQIGISIAFNVGKIIIAHLTLSEFPHSIPTWYLPSLQCGGFVLVNFLNWVRPEMYYIDLSSAVNNITWLGFGISVGIYWSFIAEIITEISAYLDIWVLSIKHPKKID